MKITTKNLYGIHSSEITCDKITGIFGRNGAGKTSLLRFIGAAMTKKTIPVDGIRKQDGILFVVPNASEGEITLEYPNGKTTLQYPSTKKTVEGAPFEISEYAAGFSSFLDLSTKERSEKLGSILQTLPTEDELKSAIEPANMSHEVFARLWQTITAQGWDAAHSGAREKGIKLKGQWEGETGERYGSEKALQWVPGDWDATMDNTTEEKLREELKHEQEWLEAALSESAVSASEIARLQELAVKIPELKSQVERDKESIRVLILNASQLSIALKNMPLPEKSTSTPCPHCSKPLAVESGKIIIPVILSDDEISKRRKNISDCTESIEKLKLEIDVERTALAKNIGKLEEALRAEKSLQEIKNKKSSEQNHRPVQDCRNRVARAQGRLDDMLKRNKARQIATGIAVNKIIVDALAPDGLRLKTLTRGIDKINKMLADLSVSAEWPVVKISENMAVTFGDDMLVLKSESEKYRARCVLQVAISKLDGSELILIDGADILDGQGRNGLFKMLLSSGIRAVVTCTINSFDQVPALSKIGGASYWIESGVSREVK